MDSATYTDSIITANGGYAASIGKQQPRVSAAVGIDNLNNCKYCAFHP